MKTHDSIIESSILGMILIDPNYCFARLTDVVEADFYEPRNRQIYTALQTMFNKGEGIDTILLNKYLGGKVPVSYVAALPDSVATCQHITDYVKQLTELSRRRTVIDHIAKLSQALKDGKDTDTEVDRFLQAVSDIKKKQNKGIVALRDIIHTVYNEIKEGKQKGILTGFRRWDEVSRGLQPQNLITIASGTGKGKTTFALNVVCNIAEAGYGSLIFSMEMSNTELSKKMLTSVAEVESNVSNKEIDENQWISDVMKQERKDKRFAAAGKLSDWNIWLDDRPQTIESITANAKSKKFEIEQSGKTLDLIVVDYVQLVKSLRSENREQQVGHVADGLKFLAKELNLPVIALAQTNREADKDKREYNVGDLRESARIEQDSDLIIFLNQDRTDFHKYTLSCKKNRHGDQFTQGLTFENQWSKFVNRED